jgi:chorismate mutase
MSTTTPSADAPVPEGDWRPRLDALRGSIDNLDAALVHILAERFRATRQVGALKATHGLPPADPGREQRQIERLQQLCDDAGLDGDLATRVMRMIIDQVIRDHERIAEERAAHEA